MKKLSKVFAIMVVCVIAFAVVAPVLGIGEIDKGLLGSEKANEKVETAAQSLWGTVTLVVQILAVACVVFSGLRYMFASADAKADIKKQTIILVVGAILVFGATTILNIVQSVAADL